jgi:hypothetical protein
LFQRNCAGSDQVGTDTDYLVQADFCRRMAEQASTTDLKSRWLELTAKWLLLAENRPEQSDTVSGPKVHLTVL